MLLAALLLSFSFASTPDHIVLYPGHSMRLETPARGAVGIERKGIVRVQDHGRSINIVGIKTGETRMIIAKKKILITVITKKRFKTYQHLQKWHNGRLGPLLTIDKGKPVVTGHLYTFRDWLDLKKFTSKNDDFVLTAKIASDIKDEITKELKKVATDNGLPFPEFQLEPEWALATDSNKSDVLKLYRDLFSPLGLKVKHSPFSLSSAPMIEVNILVTEIKRSHLTNIGISWPSSAQASLVPKLDWANPQSLLVQAEAFEQNGMGKVLASPTLLAKSGEQATFHAGGEMPIKTTNQFNSNVLWKKYGILLTVTPKADFSGKISINLDCEVSMIDQSQEIDGVPGILTNRIASHFNLSKGRTIAISGLIKDEWGKNKKGLPGLQHIPILGSLFSSESYLNQKTELLFFVTPKVIY